MSNSQRALRLNKLFDGILKGSQNITSANSNHFLEAICNQPDPATCVSKIITSSAGLASLQSAMRSNLSLKSLNGAIGDTLAYFQAPELQLISQGDFLNPVILAIVEPPIFWNAFFGAFETGTLEIKAQTGFAWLLLQLVSLPGQSSAIYRAQVQERLFIDKLEASSSLDIRNLAQKIRTVISSRSTNQPRNIGESSPGGRHDNDFADFHEIAILPTADEISSTEHPFFHTSDALDDIEDGRLPVHLDNQFRLLRGDMLYDIREELEIALGKKKGKHRGMKLDGLKPIDLHFGEERRRVQWGIQFECAQDLPQLRWIKEELKRKKHLIDNRQILKQGSLTVLFVDGEIVAFPVLNRDEDLLSKPKPVIVLQFTGRQSITRALMRFKGAKNISLVQLDTAVFAFEPVLRGLQHMTTLSLGIDLLYYEQTPSTNLPMKLLRIVEALSSNPSTDLQPLLNTRMPIVLDSYQAESLLMGLLHRVALIQGPPGTGKSFIGSLLAKTYYDTTSDIILVVCYTNHALDDVLEGLLDIGIPGTDMVRLGGKSTTRTENLSLYKQKSSNKRSRTDWTLIDSLKSAADGHQARLEGAYGRYTSSNMSIQNVMDYLEFEVPAFFEAFQVPTNKDGMTQVGRKGKSIHSWYLIEQWLHGTNGGIFTNNPVVRAFPEVWGLSKQSREDHLQKWRTAMLREQISEICDISCDYNDTLDQLASRRSDDDIAVLASKRIIGCTTTAAAKYGEVIQAARPGVLLVEEAGEILESHVLTAIGKNMEKVILIGDHKQLRPKVNNYQLTVECGGGFDLNVSLFERLIKKEFPHSTLSQQHRMRPEISALVRHLTYPELTDAAKTKNRPNLRGVEDNVVFINHFHPEDTLNDVNERRETSSASSSKQNAHEVQMILKIVRYLGQQGYGTDKLVILTPYLGQLQALRTALKKENDPVLNDLDSFDLIQAGLISPGTASLTKKPIRLATIDNYQGEESDVVLVSLTRSNAAHDIGFMSSPERVNVMLSRARNALIMIGSLETFMNARKGKELWTQLFSLLKDGNHIYDGLPVYCDRHPDRRALLEKPQDFDDKSPDGGCLEPCGAILSCGTHSCPSKCHQIADHSKMKCESAMLTQCQNGHQQSWRCHAGKPETCPKCERDRKLAEKKQKEAFERQQKEDEERIAHEKAMQELQDQIALEAAAMQDIRRREERANALLQKKKDLEEMKSRAKNMADRSTNAAATSPASRLDAQTDQPSPGNTASAFQWLQDHLQPILQMPFSTPLLASQDSKSAPPVDTGTDPAPPKLDPSSSEQDWKRRKEVEGASNDAIDAIMGLTGLEEVKSKVMEIYDKVEVTKRQGTDLKSERFNVVFLGNPGTGKTTVARQYAKFLASLQVLPGSEFIETTGARMADDGVPAAKKQLETILNAGGGTLFVDEAYQLTAAHAYQGRQVLDFLLAEMENNVGKIVFILAGYDKEMESFFEHNPGLTSRVPYQMRFKDYNDKELLSMFISRVNKKFEGKMKVEGGMAGLFSRIFIARLGRQRGRPGFGNARALQNVIDKMSGRQAVRLAKERREGKRPDDFLLVKEDLIGPEPSQALQGNPAWEKLQKLTGLNSVKQSVKNLMGLIEANYWREMKEETPLEVSLNCAFLGSPGTGKTTVAKLYGKILADLGLLSNGEVVIKNPADFVGSALGQSEDNTKKILAATVGKVLIIDEAYMLNGSAGPDSSNNNDIYKTAVIDTIVAEVQSVSGEDRCVLLLGYKEEMERMFQQVNPGLARRFSIENAFNFDDFSDSELREILNFKLKDQGLDATNEAKDVAIEVLSRLRARPNFGNAGEVENLISRAKTNQQARTSSLPAKERAQVVFLPQDIDPKFDRGKNATANLANSFKDIVGCGDIAKRLEMYQKTALRAKERGSDMRELLPTNFVFKGPPGTGKTTIARLMGTVYFDMGFLSSAEVVECSASDLVGQYVGQTGPKTKKLLKKAVGRVLFIDEAYRLCDGHFAKEAIDELVAALTLPEFLHKIVVILAGYDHDMDRLLAVNAGLASRFSEQVIFTNMSSEHCLQVLHTQLQKKDIHFPAVQDSTSPTYKSMQKLIDELSALPSWGNARDMVTLSKKMITSALIDEESQSSPGLAVILRDNLALDIMSQFLQERRGSSVLAPDPPSSSSLQPPVQMQSQSPPPPPAPPRTTTSTSTRTASKPPKAAPKKPAKNESQAQTAPGRDPGVPDHVWQQLQRDRKAADAIAEKARLAEKQALRKAQDLQRREREAKELARKLEREQAAVADNERKKRLEQARLEELRLRAEWERAERELKEKRRAEDARRKKEAEAQAKLRQMGVCPVGYRWIKQDGGYRCAGGIHFVSNGQLGM